MAKGQRSVRAGQQRPSSLLVLPHSQLRPGIFGQVSPIGGLGLFTDRPIPAGEVVIVWGGQLYPVSALMDGRVRFNSAATVSEGWVVGQPEGAPQDICELMNHSCDPNLHLQDALTLTARRDIAAGEELTADYAMFDSEPEWVMPCHCATPFCRGTVAGTDWQRPELIARYGAFFSPYLLARQARRPISS